MGKDFRELGRELKFLIVGDVLAPFQRNLRIDWPIEAVVDLTKIEKLREEFEFMNLPLFEVLRIESAVPVGIGETRSTNQDSMPVAHRFFRFSLDTLWFLTPPNATPWGLLTAPISSMKIEFCRRTKGESKAVKL